MFLYTECYAALLIRFSIAKYTILRMKPIVQVFQVKTLQKVCIIIDCESSANQKLYQNSTNFIDVCYSYVIYIYTQNANEKN